MTEQKQETSSKKVTVLHLTFNGLGNLPQGSGAETTASILGSCFSFIDPIIKLYWGTFNKYLGESAVVFFGLNNEQQNASIQAVKSAIEMQNKLSEMKTLEELPEAIGLQIGIFSGEIFIAKIGIGINQQKNYFGETINLASHICSVATPGQILVGEETYKGTHQNYTYNVLEPVPVKGYKKALSIYEVLTKNIAPTETPLQSGRLITSRMVGRQQDVRALEESIKQLLNGRGGVVNIEGMAGIGKSRLMAEIKSKEITSNVAFFEGRALSEGKNLSFHPIIQIIKSWAGITDEDNPATSFQKLSQNIIRIYPEQATEIIPFVATMMGYTLDGEERKRVKGIEGEALEKLILKNVRDLLSRAAGIRPIALVVEDAHWADLSSISFMESLFKLVRNHRLLFINVFRPGFKETGEHLKAFIKENLPEHSREIAVNQLKEEESAELINNLLNQTNLPGEIKELIIRRSEGNPFFIEEVIRSFIDEGLIEVKNNNFSVIEQIQFANIPETINKVILGRIERLDEKTKSLLRTASVIGRNFYYKVLEEAAQTIEELDTRLEYLKETQLLNEHTHKEDVEFLFKHALAQQATYDSILQETKKELHLKIARSIEKVFAEKIHEFYGVLAMHYGKAEVPEKMEEYLVKAGEQSLTAGASSEAISYFKQALDIYFEHNKTGINKQKVADLEEKIGIAYAMKGLNLEALDYFIRVLEFYNFYIPRNKTIRILGAAFYFISFTFLIRSGKVFLRKQPSKKIETVYRMIIHKGEALATVNPERFFIDSQFMVKVFIRYGVQNSNYALGLLSSYSVFFSWLGFFFKTANRNLELCNRLAISKETISWLQHKFAVKMFDYFSGKWQEDPEYEYTYNLGIQKGAVWELTIYLLYTGFILAEKGNITKSLFVASKLFEASDYFENSHARAQGYRLKSYSYLKFRKLKDVIIVTTEGIHYTGKTNHIAMLQVLHCHKCIAFSLLNESEEAVKNLLEAEKLVQQSKIVKIYICEYLLAKCHYEIALLRKEQSLNHTKWNKLLKTNDLLIRKARTVPSIQMEAYRLRAIVCWLINKQRKAFLCLDKSLELAQRLDAKPELARTCLELGKCLMDPKSRRNIVRSKNGSEYLLKAKSMFEELDMQCDLQEYVKYMEG